MSDYIDRQAAIDALFELYEYQRDIDPTEAADLFRQGVYLAEKKIEQLPSVHPDHVADIGKKVDGDCISRQAAIAAITDELMPSTPLSAVIRAKNRLKELPSVQPDHVADIGKKVEGDCISRQMAIDAMKDALDPHIVQFVKSKMAIEVLPSAQPEQRWVPCSERLPERADNVIICYKAGDYTLVSTGRYLYKFKMWYVDVVGDLRDGVTAWMPLPEPYRGGGKE